MLNLKVFDLLSDSFTCICAKGQTGPQCDVKINPCDSSPCYGGATCKPLDDHFECICPPGFAGKSCHTRKWRIFFKGAKAKQLP